MALHLLDRHFAPGLHEAIGLGTPVATRRRDMASRAAVLEAYLAECCICGFSLRLVDGLIAVDAAHIRWHAHGGPDEVSNGLALCALHHRLFDHGAITVREDLRVRVARSLAGSSARDLLKELDGQRVRLPVDEQFYPSHEHLRCHHFQVRTRPGLPRFTILAKSPRKRFNFSYSWGYIADCSAIREAFGSCGESGRAT